MALKEHTRKDLESKFRNVVSIVIGNVEMLVPGYTNS
jgi:hypothetical protein